MMERKSVTNSRARALGTVKRGDCTVQTDEEFEGRGGTLREKKLRSLRGIMVTTHLFQTEIALPPTRTRSQGSDSSKGASTVDLNTDLALKRSYIYISDQAPSSDEVGTQLIR